MRKTGSEQSGFRTLFALLVAGLLFSSAGCASTLSKAGAILPDNTIPHRVAEEAVILVWARNDKGELVKTKIRVLPGWWVAGPRVVEP